MSLPPQVITVKRKRDEDEAPVTYLQFDDGVKRARSSTDWVYQRRDRTKQPHQPREDIKPIIQISKPDDASRTPQKKTRDGHLTPRKTLSPRPSMQRMAAARAEPRRFHLSKAMMLGATAATQSASGPGISRKGRTGPAVFVERSRKKMAERSRANDQQQQQSTNTKESIPVDGQQLPSSQSETTRKLKKPTTSRAKPLQKDGASAPARVPLPAAATQPHTADMDRIAAEMDRWVLNEIGANLHDMEEEKKKEKPKFKPKAPSLRYHERHPEQAASMEKEGEEEEDTMMVDNDIVSEDGGDDSDWVIEEYIRVPANSVIINVSPGDVGVLVLEGEEDDILFFGPDHDEDDDYLEDDEDENAENYYTADYPEDEVNSDDEFNQHAYLYRHGNASDDEEFDNDLYSEGSNDEMVLEGDDDDIAMARIKAFIRRRREADQQQFPQ